jgi:hypothetical protein
VWQRLLDRAGPRPGLPSTDDPDLHLLADGVRVDGTRQAHDRILFALSQRPHELRVVSRAGSPAELGSARDPRLLGVAVRQIRVWHGARVRTLDASDASLTEGFHAFEADNGCRWTDGDAALPGTLFDHIVDTCECELLLGGTTSYPLIAETRPQTA